MTTVVMAPKFLVLTLLAMSDATTAMDVNRKPGI